MLLDRYQWVDKDGGGATGTVRVAQTLLKGEEVWRIIGGMSMPEVANPQK